MSRLKHKIIIEDTTLRDGEQSPGISFSKNTKVKIFHYLVDIGLKWIEAGTPAMKGEEVKYLKEILERKNEVNIFSWNRGVLEDIKYSISLGFKFIHIGLPTSKIHLKHSIGKNRLWLLKTSANLIKYCKDKDLYVSISAEDIGRTSTNFLQEYAINVQNAGADRLRLSDTIGILDYVQYGNKIKKIKKICDIDLQCHCHNDFGLAIANTISGLKSGAKFFHTCINGIGERAGMPDFSQMVMLLKQLYKVDLGVNIRKLVKLSQKFAKFTNQNIYPWHPIIGKNTFKHESGIHTKGILNYKKTFEPFDPKIIGKKSQITIGKHSGRNSIKYFLKKRGINVKEKILKECLKILRKKSENNIKISIKKELCNLYNLAKKKINNEK